MKITELKQIIREEIQSVLNEGPNDEYICIKDPYIMIRGTKFFQGDGNSKSLFDSMTHEEQKHFMKIPDYLKKMVDKRNSSYDTKPTSQPSSDTNWYDTFDVNNV
jgi:hypothetical protein